VDVVAVCLLRSHALRITVIILDPSTLPVAVLVLALALVLVAT
jgi:hypothetical protein